MLNESQQKPKPRRQHNIHKKRQDETNDVQIGSEEGKEEEKTKIKKSAKKRRQHARGIRILADSQAARVGGVAPRQNNIICHQRE